MIDNILAKISALNKLIVQCKEEQQMSAIARDLILQRMCQVYDDMLQLQPFEKPKPTPVTPPQKHDFFDSEPIGDAIDFLTMHQTVKEEESKAEPEVKFEGETVETTSTIKEPSHEQPQHQNEQSQQFEQHQTEQPQHQNEQSQQFEQHQKQPEYHEPIIAPIIEERTPNFEANHTPTSNFFADTDEIGKVATIETTTESKIEEIKIENIKQEEDSFNSTSDRVGTSADSDVNIETQEFVEVNPDTGLADMDLRNILEAEELLKISDELFNGDDAAANDFLEKLSAFTDLDDAVLFIHEQLPDKMNSQSTALLGDVLSAKFE